jgi:hypothetical protein
MAEHEYQGLPGGGSYRGGVLQGGGGPTFLPGGIGKEGSPPSQLPIFRWNCECIQLSPLAKFQKLEVLSLRLWTLASCMRGCG